MRQPDYKTANRQMGFVPGMKPPRNTQQNTAPMGLGQPAGQPQPAQPAAPMPPTPGAASPMGGPPPPAGPQPPPMGGPGMPPPPGPLRADVERQLWAGRHSRNPVAVLADAYQKVLQQPPDYDKIDQLLNQRGIDGALQELLANDPQSLLRGTMARPASYMRRAILGS